MTLNSQKFPSEFRTYEPFGYEYDLLLGEYNFKVFSHLLYIYHTPAYIPTIPLIVSIFLEL